MIAALSLVGMDAVLRACMAKTLSFFHILLLYLTVAEQEKRTMRTQNLRRWPPQQRRRWLWAALLPAFGGLLIAACCLTPVGRFAAAAFAAIGQPRADQDAHNHADGLDADDHDEDEHDHHPDAPGLAEAKHEDAGAIKLSKQGKETLACGWRRSSCAPLCGQ